MPGARRRLPRGSTSAPVSYFCSKKGAGSFEAKPRLSVSRSESELLNHAHECSKSWVCPRGAGQRPPSGLLIGAIAGNHSSNADRAIRDGHVDRRRRPAARPSVSLKVAADAIRIAGPMAAAFYRCCSVEQPVERDQRAPRAVGCRCTRSRGVRRACLPAAGPSRRSLAAAN